MAAIGEADVCGIRCTEPHPRIPGWQCNARLADAQGGVDLVRGAVEGPAVQVRCRRCKTLWSLVRREP